MEHGDGSGFVSGLLIGATLGAMGALLLAPKSGRALREDMAREGERLRERAEATTNDWRARGQRAVVEVKDTVRGTARGLQQAGRVLKEGTGAQTATEKGTEGPEAAVGT